MFLDLKKLLNFVEFFYCIKMSMIQVSKRGGNEMREVYVEEERGGGLF